MAELAAADVETYTNGQLSAAAPETQRMLDAALAAARCDCRWHVSPVNFGETITINGSGLPWLVLPTKQLIAIHAVSSDGVPLDPVNDITIDAGDGPFGSACRIIRNSGVFSPNYRGITLTWDHGFPEDATAAAAIPGYSGEYASEWRQAVLSLVTSIAQIAMVGRPDYELNSKQIDDVVYRWAANPSMAAAGPLLDRYRLLYQWV